MKNRTLLVAMLFGVVLVSLATPPALFAKTGFQKGRWMIDLRGGGLFSITGDPQRAVDSVNKSYLPVGYYTLTSGSESDRILSYATYISKEKAKINGETGEFAFEYALLDWLGIGADIHHSNYRVSGVPQLGLRYSMYDNFLIGLMLRYSGQPISNIILLETIDPFLTGSVQFVSATTLNFNVAFHLNSHSTWDPYVKIHLGFGGEAISEATILGRAGITLGSRFFVSDGFYIQTEVTSAYNYLQASTEGGSGETVILEGEYTEAYGQAGIGFAI